MATVASLQDLDQTLSARVGDLRAVAPVFQALKTRYTEVYGEHELRYQLAIGPAVDRLIEADADAGPALHGNVLAWLPLEEESAEARHKELRDKILPALEADIAALVQRSQTSRRRHHLANTQAAQREQSLQASIAAGEAELARLNAEVKAKSRWLGVFWRFFAVNKLVRARNKTFKEVGHLHHQLEQLRRDWQDARQKESAAQASYQEETQARLLEQARLQAEFDYLDDAERRAALAHQRAARHVIDELREPVACPLPDLEKALAELAELNVIRDRYQEGINKAAHLEGLANGLLQGVEAFGGGIQKMIRQQKQYSAYLKPLRITAPQASLDFFSTLAALRKTFASTRGFAEDPVLFAQRAQGFIAALSDDTIRIAFESLGAALTSATETQWK